MNITYHFEEIPILTEGGFQAGLVNGSANISIHEGDEPGAFDWFVNEIYLTGHRKWENGRGFETKEIEIEDQHGPLYLAIWGELSDGSFKDSVQAKVDEETQWIGADTRRTRELERAS